MPPNLHGVAASPRMAANRVFVLFKKLVLQYPMKCSVRITTVVVVWLMHGCKHPLKLGSEAAIVQPDISSCGIWDHVEPEWLDAAWQAAKKGWDRIGSFYPIIGPSVVTFRLKCAFCKSCL